MLESMIALIFLPLVIGATVGSLYFVVNNNEKHPWQVLIPLAFISWVFGYSVGLPLAETMYAMLVSLFGSAMAIVLLDTTTRNIQNDDTPPKILVWVLDVIKSLRGR